LDPKDEKKNYKILNMKNKLFYLVLSIIILTVSCKKEEEKSEAEIKDEKENLLCRKWEQTLLTIDGDTSSTPGLTSVIEFNQDRSYLLFTTITDGNGEVIYDLVDTLDWRWSGEQYNSVEVTALDNENEWIHYDILELSEIKLILEQNSEVFGVLRYYYKPE
jgi:hypothetical protein